MKYEVEVMLKDVVVLSWRFKSITQVCKFIDSAFDEILDFAVFRIGKPGQPWTSIDVDELMNLWRIDRE